MSSYFPAIASILCGGLISVFAESQPATNAPAAPAATNHSENADEILARVPTKASEEHTEILGRDLRSNGPVSLNKREEASDFQLLLESARQLRADDPRRAEAIFIQILEGRAPEEIKRPATLELAQLMQEQRSYAKAQRLYSEYIRRFPKDAGVPEVLLRQAYLYREMGLPELAFSKFFAVMSACLNLQVEELEYYQKLVLRAQLEIAQTYYSEGKFKEASEYLNKVLKLETTEINRADSLYKLIRCYWNLQDYSRAIANARLLLEKHPDSADTPETRFLLADSLKKLGQDKEAIQEILVLLQKQQENSRTDPAQWLYWQQRAGNDIANQFYKQGDFLKALRVYETLAELNGSSAWQLPAWYQIGLVFENLKQPARASEMYERILTRTQAEKDTTAADSTLSTIAEMARWRRDFLAWELKAQSANKQLEQPAKDDQTDPGLASGS